MKKVKLMIALLMAMIMMTIPVCAEGLVENGNARYNNFLSANLSITFDSNRVAHCTLTLVPLDHCTGISGVIRLYNSDNVIIAAWAVSDYERPFSVEHTYQCEKGETYTLTYGGHIYSNNGTSADRLDLSTTNTCR